MATANSNRGTRRSGRLSGGNRPRTHPSPKPHKSPRTQVRPPAPTTARTEPSKLGKSPDARPGAASLGSSAPPEVTPSICALYEIRARLKGIAACIAVVVIALKAQSADADRDFAVTLDLCVGDELSGVRERVDGLIYPRGA